MSPGQCSKKPTPQQPDMVALQLVLSGGGIAFLNIAGQPRLRRPTDSVDEVVYPVFSQETARWIARIFQDNTGTLLDRSSIDRVQLCLAGLAEKIDESDGDLCDAIDDEPILGLLIEIVREQQRIKTTAGKLLTMLSDRFKAQPELRSFETWPASPEALGKRLRRIKRWIEKAHIRVDFTHERDHRWIILCDCRDSATSLPSQDLSGRNSGTYSDLRLADTSDGHVGEPELEFRRIMLGGVGVS